MPKGRLYIKNKYIPDQEEKSVTVHHFVSTKS